MSSMTVAVIESLDSGDRIEAGDPLFRVEGPARDVLRAERPATNVTMHASGIATAALAVLIEFTGATPGAAIRA